MIIGMIIGMVVGGVIVYLFKDQITKDEAAVVAAFNTEAAKLKAAHTTAVVAAVKTPTNTATFNG